MQATFNKEQKKVLLLSSLGGVLEFYDFIIYIYMAPYIEKLFFSGNTSSAATLKTLAVFSAGYLLRPLGGIIFSHFGDRYGRKTVFLLTVVLMAVPSLFMGLLPTVSNWSYAAYLLLLFRIMQGLSLGGEIPAAITFVSEQVPNNRQGIGAATLFFGVNLGLLLGSLVTTLLAMSFTQDEILAFAWRIPFLLGGMFGVIAIFLRRYLHETKAFLVLKPNEIEILPMRTVLERDWRSVLQSFFMVSLGAIAIFLFLYWPQYLHKYFQFDLRQLMPVNTVATLMLNLMILVGGWCVDRFGAKVVYQALCLLLALLVYPLFILFTWHHLGWVIVSYAVFSVIFGFFPSAYCAIMVKLFNTSVRYTGVALSYNLAYALLGGLSPIVCTLLIETTGSLLAPAFYVLAIALIAFGACQSTSRTSAGLLTIRETKR